ncbi:DNA-directed RNA polymerase [Blastocladiella britannica]|nr:DNA-directed RNA polymerase [Blastocladiella britannica]
MQSKFLLNFPKKIFEYLTMSAAMDVDAPATALPAGIAQRISLVAIEGEDVSTDNCVTFCIAREDHTMGGILRYLIARNPNVTFCGYSVPHPSEDMIHFRIETDGSISPADALRAGLDGVIDISDHMMDALQAELKDGHFEVDDEPEL